jgi:O-antigen ligase
VQTLSVVLLVLTLLYVILGLPGDDAADASQTDHVNPLNSWIWLGLLASSMPVLRRRWRDVMALTAGNWALVSLMFYFALSVTWALDPGASLRRLLFTIVQLVLFAILLSGIRRAPVVHVVIAAVCAVAALADLAYWVAAPGSAMTDEGFAGLQSQKNQTGLLMMYGCLAAASCMFLMRRWLWKAVFLAATVLMAALLVATRSTTSQSVVLSAAVGMPLLWQAARLPRRVILTIVAVVVVILPASIVLGYLAWCGITGEDLLAPVRNMTFSARTGIWFFVIQEIQKRPLLGAGYSSFWAINPEVQPSLRTNEWFSLFAIINEGHNGYLDLLATGGVIGFAGGLFVLVRSIILAGRAMNHSQASAEAWSDGHLARPTAIFHLALLLGLVIHNFTESNLFSNNALLAVGFLLCVLDLEKWRIANGDAQSSAVPGSD